jgi:hypothetical protein
MRARQEGYESLVCYTVLEPGGAIVDMVSHRLVAPNYYDPKTAAAMPTHALGSE